MKNKPEEKTEKDKLKDLMSNAVERALNETIQQRVVMEAEKRVLDTQEFTGKKPAPEQQNARTQVTKSISYFDTKINKLRGLLNDIASDTFTI